MTAHLDVHGIGVRLQGQPEAVEELANHFESFRCPSGHLVTVDVRLNQGQARLPTERRWRADQVLDRGIVYNQGAQCWVDHHGFALSHYDYERECGEVVAEGLEDLVELGYLMVHSRLGVHLEQRGLVRIHAVGFCLHGAAGLVLTPAGGGKSRLALALLHDGRVKLLSDDVVLLDRRGRAHPFPHPIGISDPDLAQGLGQPRVFCRRHHGKKWVVGLRDLLARHQVEPVPVRQVAMARRVNRPPSEVFPASRSHLASALWRDLVMGLGLPQVLELIARRGTRDLWRQAPSALARLRVAAALLASVEAVELDIADPESAVERLLAAFPRSS